MLVASALRQRAEGAADARDSPAIRRCRGSCSSKIIACCARRLQRRRPIRSGRRTHRAAAAGDGPGAAGEGRPGAHSAARRARDRPHEAAAGRGDPDAAARRRTPSPRCDRWRPSRSGLIGRKDAAPALRTALSDASPVVRGRAAEALGLIGDTESAPAIGAMVGLYVKAGVLANDRGRRIGLSAVAGSRGRAPRDLRVDASEGLRRAGRRGARRLGHAGQPLVARRVRVPARRRSEGRSCASRAPERRRRLHAGFRRPGAGRTERRGQRRSAR